MQYTIQRRFGGAPIIAEIEGRPARETLDILAFIARRYPALRGAEQA